MNIIRTKAVELTVIPALGYKQKLAQGGSGLKILRMDKEASAVATIDKRTGEPEYYGSVDENIFPMEAFDELMELTCGLPYSARGKVKLVIIEEPEADDVPDEPEKMCMLDSIEYQAITERYMDEKGKMNYQLMNKDFIKFAAKSKTVSDMVGNMAKTEEILNFIVKSRASFIAGTKESLGDSETNSLIETLDEIDPRSAFKELKLHIKRMLAKQGRR